MKEDEKMTDTKNTTRKENNIRMKKDQGEMCRKRRKTGNWRLVMNNLRILKDSEDEELWMKCTKKSEGYEEN